MDNKIFKEKTDELFMGFSKLHSQYMNESKKRGSYATILKCYNNGNWKIIIKRVYWWNKWIVYLDKILHDLKYHKNNNSDNEGTAKL